MMNQVRIGKYQLHFGEEPCISGTRGSGTVFFSGCNLGCVFCQNEPISRHGMGKQYSVEELAGIFRELEEKGAHNINIVTGYPWIDRIIEAFELRKPAIPIIWNSSGYERVEEIKKLEPYVNVYLPDFKYAESALAEKFSHHYDYPEVALCAVREMLRQKGNPEFDENGMIKSGVIIRHLVLPLHLKNSSKVLQTITENFPDAWVSFMLQYTPVVKDVPFDELKRTLTKRECEKALSLLEESGIVNGFVQDAAAATTELIPKFEEK